ncbi:MAG TPA: hypothetical protein VHR66_20735 [Gemmataceae bacterium]|nr:hypothetical protein [Gemmataceae bacterium]
MKTLGPATAISPSDTLRDDCAREVFTVAEALRRTGRQRRLRDVTIVLPIDHSAVEAIELACQMLSEGDLSPASAELDRFMNQLIADPPAAERFLQSVRSVVRRVGPTGPAR